MPAHATAPMAEILKDPRIWRGDGLSRGARPGRSSGFPALDAELPGGGWPPGALSEILSQQVGDGVFSLLRPLLAREAERGLQIMLIAPPFVPYAPAWAAAGIEPARLSWIHPSGAEQALWAMEQTLREAGCLVCAWHRGPLNDRSTRRLQLAAETGGGNHFLVRLDSRDSLQSPLALRLAVQSLPDALQVRILKRRGRPLPHPLILPLTENVHALSGSFPAAPGPGSRRAAPCLGTV